MSRLKILIAAAILAAALAGICRAGWYLCRRSVSQDVCMTEGDLKRGHTVVIDAGHGGFDAGKVGINQAAEKDVNLMIAKKLREELKNRGIDSIMTRKGTKALADTKAGDMKKRVDIINASGADLAVSIHQNSYTDPDIRGAQVFYYVHSEGGKLAADAVQNALLQADPENTRRPKGNDTYYILKRTAMPVIIVECGFLSNFEEAQKLVSPDYQEKLACAVADGIKEYFFLLF